MVQRGNLGEKKAQYARKYAQTGAILKSVHFRIYFIKFDMAEM